MIDLDITFLVQLVNFLIAWMVLNLFLFRPIRGIIKKRAEHMAEQMDSIDKFNSNAERKLKDYEEALSSARIAGNETRAQFKEEAMAQERGIMDSAHSEAAGKLSQARAEIKSQVDSAMSTLKGSVEGMAEKAAGKILG